ncbi:MAG: metallophosphoesterase family protein [Opitutaceae bacterium]
MRIAILADIHGNLPALEAALARVDALRPDRVVVAGDLVVGGPDSAACWQALKGRGWPTLRGNHERYVFDFGTPRAKPDWATERFGPVRWAVAQFDAGARAELAALPAVLRLPEAPGVLFVHGSPRNDHDLVFPYTSDARLAECFGGVAEQLVVRAHNHYCGVRDWSGGRIVTVGSVGLPLDGTTAAQFTLLERDTAAAQGWRVQHHTVPYDVAAAVRRFRTSGYLEAAGPMAELYRREVETAAFHVVPFLTFLAATPGAGEWPLAEALARFNARHG